MRVNRVLLYVSHLSFGVVNKQVTLHFLLCSLHRLVELASALEALLVLPVTLRRVSPNHATLALDAPLSEHVIQKTHLLLVQFPGCLRSFLQGVLLPHVLPNTPILLHVMKNADDMDARRLLPMRPVAAAGVVLVQEVDHEDQLVRLVDDPFVGEDSEVYCNRECIIAFKSRECVND